MSIKSWELEFYPQDAIDCPKKNAAQHSLRKWLGLRAAALKKHGLKRNEGAGGLTIVDDDGRYFTVCSDTCSLCHHYTGDGESCDCPLDDVMGMSCNREGSPFCTWLDRGNPGPMIKALRKLVNEQKKQRGEK